MDILAELKLRLQRYTDRGRHPYEAIPATACTKACREYVTSYGYLPQSAICPCLFTPDGVRK